METIREAQIVSLNDPDQLGKIQVRILPEMLNFKTSDLPWAGKYNQGTGCSADVGLHELPEINSYVRVIIEDWPLLKRIRYISDDYIEGLYVYSKSSDLDSITELGTQTYPQPFFKSYKDGTIEFHNSTTGEHGTFFSNGEYYLKDATGNIFVNTKAKSCKVYNNNGYLELKSNGNLELNGNTKHLVTWEQLDAAINTAVTGFISQLNLHTHPTAASGPPSPPTVSMTLDISTAKTTSVLTE